MTGKTLIWLGQLGKRTEHLCNMYNLCGLTQQINSTPVKFKGNLAIKKKKSLDHVFAGL